jgi:hypothetical protein
VAELGAGRGGAAAALIARRYSAQPGHLQNQFSVLLTSF